MTRWFMPAPKRRGSTWWVFAIIGFLFAWAVWPAKPEETGDFAKGWCAGYALAAKVAGSPPIAPKVGILFDGRTIRCEARP